MREQIIAQISLGITSGDLKAGEKLPSTRELARRFQIHQNTISNAYRRLAEQNLVEFKKGSGVYICEKGNNLSKIFALDRLINQFFQNAAAQGFANEAIKAALQKHLTAKKTARFLLIEPEPNLRKILIEEISGALNAAVEGISPEDLAGKHFENEAETWLMFDKAEIAPETLPPNVNCVLLKANSVPDSMTGKQRPAETDLVAIVSGWETFLTLAKMFLLAARIAPETLIVRSTNEPNWKNGLPAASMIICDSATAEEFPNDKRVRIFQLIADESLEKLRESAA